MSDRNNNNKRPRSNNEKEPGNGQPLSKASEHDFNTATSTTTNTTTKTTGLEVTADEVVTVTESEVTAGKDEATAKAASTSSVGGDSAAPLTIDALEYCSGITNKMIKEVFQTTPHLVVQKFSIFPPGQFRHPECRFILPPIQDSNNNNNNDKNKTKKRQCVKCSSAQKNIKRTRHPEIYAARDNVRHALNVDKLAIEVLLKRKYEELKSDTLAFLDDDDVKFLYEVCKLHHPDVKTLRLCNLHRCYMNFCDSHHLNLNTSCRGFWLTGKPAIATVTSCPNCTASKRNADRHKIKI